MFIIPEDEICRQAALDGITHLSTGVAIVRSGKVLAVRREVNDFMGGEFELPGGGVDDGETLEEAVKREVREETGLTVQKIVGMFSGFDYTTPKKPKVRQFNFLVEADGGVSLSSEHDQFQWVGQDEVANLKMSEEMRQCFYDAFQALEPRA